MKWGRACVRSAGDIASRMDNYLALTLVSGPTYCVLKGLSVAVGRPGRAQGATWPPDVVLAMDPKFKKNHALGDAHKCLSGDPVVSARFKRLLEAEGVPEVEFLPVAIRDHGGAIASSDYFFLHPVGSLDVIDLDASELVFDDEQTQGHVLDAPRLVIRETAIPPSALCFRLARYPVVILMRRSLTEAIEAAGLTGIKFRNVEDVS